MTRPRAIAVLAALLVATVAASAREVRLTLLHTTDLHGRLRTLVADDHTAHPEAGLLRIATLIRRVRASEPNVVLVDDGDTLQGSPESWRTRGRIMVQALNALRYDAWVIGNHEFDWGLAVLQARVAECRCPVLAANIGPRLGRPPPLPAIRPFTICERDGVRVALVGLTTSGIPSWTLPDALGDAEIRGSVETLRAVLPSVKAEHPDVLVLVAHQGWRDGRADYANELTDVVREFPEFDVVIGGHSHEEVPGTMIGGTLYAQAGAHGEVLGRVDLVYDTVARRVTERRAQLLPVTAKVPEDPALLHLCSAVLAATERDLDRTIGRTAARLVPANAAGNEIAIDQLFCAALMEAAHADAAVHGTLSDASVAAGPIRERDLWRVVPFENRIGVARLTAGELREVLEECRRPVHGHAAMVLGGLRAEIDPSAPDGQRVRAIRKADGSAPHPRKRFRVAFNSYALASGGRRYPRLRAIVFRPEAQLTMLDIDTRSAVRAYVQRHSPMDADTLP